VYRAAGQKVVVSQTTMDKSKGGKIFIAKAEYFLIGYHTIY
jgi:hypothetical protein